MGNLLVEILVGFMTLGKTLSFYFLVGVIAITFMHYGDKYISKLPAPWNAYVYLALGLLIPYVCAISWRFVVNRGRG